MSAVADLREALDATDRATTAMAVAASALRASLDQDQGPVAAARILRHDTPLEVGVAVVCHEAIRAFAEMHGDTSMPAWADAPGSFTAPAIESARQLIDGSVTTPEGAHAAWLDARKGEGWKYGPQFDAINRVHPALVEWDQLSAIDRRKNELLVAIASIIVGRT